MSAPRLDQRQIESQTWPFHPGFPSNGKGGVLRRPGGSAAKMGFENGQSGGRVG